MPFALSKSHKHIRLFYKINFYFLESGDKNTQTDTWRENPLKLPYFSTPIYTYYLFNYIKQIQLHFEEEGSTHMLFKSHNSWGRQKAGKRPETQTYQLYWWKVLDSHHSLYISQCFSSQQEMFLILKYCKHLKYGKFSLCCHCFTCMRLSYTTHTCINRYF